MRPATVPKLSARFSGRPVAGKDGEAHLQVGFAARVLQIIPPEADLFGVLDYRRRAAKDKKVGAHSLVDPNLQPVAF